MARKKAESNIEGGQITLFTGQSKAQTDQYKKAVEVVHTVARHPLTLTQLKMANVMLKVAVSTPADDHGWWTIRNTELMDGVGWTESKNLEQIRMNARELQTVVYDWDVLAARTAGKMKYKSSVLFPEIEGSGDVFRFQISSEMRAKVLDPKIYALQDMHVIRQFRRAASVQLYEFCGRFSNLPQTPKVPWQLLRDMMLSKQSSDSIYDEYKYFRARVLGPCMVEVNTHAPFNIQMEVSKEGKSVNEIWFLIRKKEEPQDHRFDDVAEHMLLIGQLIKEGMPQSEAAELVRSKGAQLVQANLDYALVRRPKIKAFLPYLRKAIANNYAIVEETEHTTKQKGRSLQDRYMEHQKDEAQKYFKELSLEDQSEKIAQYNAQQQLKPLQIQKKAGTAAQNAFYIWLGDVTWGEPSQEDLLEFANTLFKHQA
jgi:hypothetical protein